MSLKDDIQARKAKQSASQPQQQQGPRVNPEIDQKLTEFIAQNPKLTDHYRSLDKEMLVRKLMLSRMMKADQANKMQDKIVQWVEQRPEVRQRINEQLKHVSQEDHGKVFQAIAKREMQKEALRSVQQL